MNLYREPRKSDQKVFAPAFEIDNLLFSHSFLFNFRVSADSLDLFSFEWLNELFEYDNGRSFWHYLGL